MAPVSMKTEAKKCEQYHTLSLIAHTCKTVMHEVLCLTERQTEEFLTDNQSGFRKGRGNQRNNSCNEANTRKSI